jgi:LuxR family maltose regulon positive regulatory protein
VVEQLASEYLVERPTLKRRLGAALSLPLTLVVAQAGAGKTVMLSQWAAEHPEISFVWMDVESADDDPVRFSRRLLSELSVIRPELGHLKRLTALNAGGLGGPLLEALSVELESFPRMVLVLDDLHHLSNRTLLRDIGRLVAAAPSNVHVVISTRVDPAITWSRLRLRSRLLEIRQGDLAMTKDESSRLLTTITGREVPNAVLDVLVRRTEGWAAGLQLAALNLKFQDDADQFVAEFSGTDRLIAEYLTEEVLDALPEGGRTVLLRMAPLETLTAGLVDHVLERSDSQRLFERLEHESMFLVALDGARETFRFHHLFRDLLRYRLRAEGPEGIAEEARLLRRAADYHLARGELSPAIEYLLRARDWDRALDAIMARGSDVFEHGEMSTVIRWITSVPEVDRADHLDVSLELGVVLGMQGQAAVAVDAMSRVAADVNASVGQRIVASAWISATAQWSPRPDETLGAAERALRLLEANPDAPIPDLMRLNTRPLLTTLAVGSGGRSHFLAGRLEEADAWLTRALTTEGVVYPPFRVGVLGSLALLRIWCGRAVEAELFAAEALDTAATAGLLNHPIIADAFLAAAMIAHERGLPDAAADPLLAGTLRVNANRRTQLAWVVRYEEALLAFGERRFEDALELIDLSGHDAMSAPAPVIHERLLALRMAVLRRSGHPAEALLVWGRSSSTAAVWFEAVAAALTLGDREAARELLASSPDPATQEGLRTELQQLIASGWFAELEGDHGGALEQVTRALDLAEPEGLVELFAESGGVVLNLVGELATARGGLAETILARAQLMDAPSVNAELLEPLTERELEILSYLPGYATNAELARLCFISVNTLKTHMVHIYQKLGVSDRSAAIARAGELGLIGPVTAARHPHA